MHSKTEKHRCTAPSYRYIGIFIGNDVTKIQVQYLYRGDARGPDSIFQEGFTARGTSTDILSHVNPIGEEFYFDSGYVSTSTSKNVAAQFPRDLYNKGFLYVINPQKNAVDVGQALVSEAYKWNINTEDINIWKREKEQAVPSKINCEDIKGAWQVEVLESVDNRNRLIGKHFIPNPHHVAVFEPVIGVAKVLGHSLTGLGIAVDALKLFEAYQDSNQSGAYSNFFQEGTRVIAAWGGAIAMGTKCGELGVSVGAPFGPHTALAGGIIGAITGSALGYIFGGEIAKQVTNVDKPLLAKTVEVLRSLQPPPAVQKPMQNFIQHLQVQQLTSNRYESHIDRLKAVNYSSYQASKSSIDYLKPKHLYMHLAEKQSAIFDLCTNSLRDSKKYFEKSLLEQRIKDSMHNMSSGKSHILSSKDLYFDIWRRMAYTSSFDYNDFKSALRATGLESSLNSLLGNSRIRSLGRSRNGIGGVATKVGIIKGLENYTIDMLLNKPQFCIKSTDASMPFTTAQLQQIIRELAYGIFRPEPAFPFFSLDFNHDCTMYPVIHKEYENTLVGNIIAKLDFWMKGFCHGGTYSSEFLDQWSNNPNTDPNFLKHNLIDLKKYCREHQLGFEYQSLREMEYLLAAQLSNGLDPDAVIDKQFGYGLKYETIFRIIAKQNSFKKDEASETFIIDADFEIQADLKPSPAYQAYLDQYKTEHGEYPTEYLATLVLYEQMKQNIHDNMQKLPFCRLYFEQLKVISFLCYLFNTLKQQNLAPEITPMVLPQIERVPKLFPHIPVRYFKIYTVKLSIADIFAATPPAELAIFFNKQMLGADAIISNQLKIFITNVMNNRIIQQIHPEAKAENPMRFESAKASATQAMLDGLQKLAKYLRTAYQQELKDLTAKITQNYVKVTQEAIDNLRKQHDSHIKSQLAAIPAELLQINTDNINNFKMDLQQQLDKQIAQIRTEANLECDSKVRELAAKLPDLMYENISSQDQKNYDSLVMHFPHSTLDIADSAYHQANPSLTHLVGGCSVQLPNQKLKLIQCENIITDKTYTKFILNIIHKPILSQLDALECTGLSSQISDREMQVMHGATQEFNPAAQNPDQQIMAHLMARLDDVDGLIRCTKGDAKYLLYPDKYGRTPVHEAASNNAVHILTYCLDKTPQLLEMQTHRGATALTIAAESGNTEAMNLLINHGANINYCMPNGLFPLYLALQGEYEDTALALITHSTLQLDLTTDKGEAALHLALLSGQTKAAVALINQGASTTLKRRGDGYTALHVAVDEGLIDITRQILQKNTQSVNIPLENGKTLLHLAVQNENLDLVKMLVQEFSATDHSDESALSLAIKNCNIEIALYFINNKIYKNPEQLQQALWQAAAMHQWKICDALLTLTDPLKTNADGYSYIFYLLAAGQCRRYLALDAKCKAPDLEFNSSSALAVVANHGHLDFAYELIKNPCSYISPWSSDVIKDTKVPVVNELHKLTNLRNTAYVRVKDRLFYINKQLKTVEELAMNVRNLAIFDETLNIKNLAGYKPISANKLALLKGFNILPDNHQVDNLALELHQNAHIKADDVGWVQSATPRDKAISIYDKIKNKEPTILRMLRFGAVQCVYAMEKYLKPDQYSSLLTPALISGKTELIDFVLKHAPTSLHTSDESGCYPVHIAVQYGHVHLLNYLHERGANLLALGTAYNMALQNQDVPMQEALLAIIQKEQWPSGLSQVTDLDVIRKYQRVTPLMHAAQQGDLAVIKSLVQQQIDINAVDIFGNTAFHYAIIKKHQEVALYLYPLVNIQQANRDGITPLMLAAQTNQLILVKLLNHPAAEACLTKNGLNALHIAAISGSTEIIDYLIASGFEVDIPTHDFYTSLQLAAQYKQSSSFRLLLQLGADLLKTNPYKKSALEYAIAAKSDKLSHLIFAWLPHFVPDINPEAVQFWLKKIWFAAIQADKDSVLRELLLLDFSIQMREEHDYNGLHYAAFFNATKCANLLIAGGIDCQAMSRELNTPIHVAAENNALMIVKQLGDTKVNLDLQNVEEKTAMYLAAEQGHLQIIVQLLLLGADFTLMDKQNTTALQIACLKKFFDIVSLLIMFGDHSYEPGQVNKLSEKFVKAFAEYQTQQQTWVDLAETVDNESPIQRYGLWKTYKNTLKNNEVVLGAQYAQQ